jgi:deazaflavin-dependent oxidoreductase (nitroreductase family)
MLTGDEASRSTRPYADAGALRRAVRRTAATAPMIWIYTRIQQPLDQAVHRLTRGRTTLSALLSGLPVVLLTTTGAQSGQQHTVPVLGIPDRAGVVVIASNYGRARHPAWYRNLRVDPLAVIVVAGVPRRVRARELSGADRDTRFDQATSLYPGFAAYEKRAAPRRIPVLLLVPRQPA